MGVGVGEDGEVISVWVWVSSGWVWVRMMR